MVILWLRRRVASGKPLDVPEKATRINSSRSIEAHITVVILCVVPQDCHKIWACYIINGASHVSV